MTRPAQSQRLTKPPPKAGTDRATQLATIHAAWIAANSELANTIRLAAREGMSLRQIGDAIGEHPSWVARRVVSDGKRSGRYRSEKHESPDHEGRG